MKIETKLTILSQLSFNFHNLKIKKEISVVMSGQFGLRTFIRLVLNLKSWQQLLILVSQKVKAIKNRGYK